MEMTYTEPYYEIGEIATLNPYLLEGIMRLLPIYYTGCYVKVRPTAAGDRTFANVQLILENNRQLTKNNNCS